MNISEAEIVHTARNTSFKDLVPISSIRTKKDVKRLNEKGYASACTKGDLKKAFPDLDITHLYISPNPLDAPCFYWDEDSLIIFAVYLYGTHAICINSEELIEYIQHGVSSIRKRVEDKDFRFLGRNLNDRMRMEYLTMLIDKDLVSYAEFLSLYLFSDYGFADIGSSRLQKMISKKSPEDVATTEKLLQNLPDPVVVYRGVGSCSTGLDAAFSWTCNPGTATFFAIRLGLEDAAIYQGLVKKSDILEYLDTSEAEIIAMPGSVYDIKKTELYGLEWLAPMLQVISPMYHEYLENADYEAIPFQIHGSVHEKGHSMRVLLHCLILGQLYSISSEDMDILADAALYHDVGRTHEGVERGHGEASAKLYEAGAEYPNDVSSFLMRYHCRPDNEGYTFIQQYYSADSDHITLLFNIFKDADGLDRIRLSLNDVDFTQLRTEEAKRLPLIANLLFKNVKVPED